uniref:Chromosome 1 open reading frame 162 n=1 Tax=Sciurus vulgaris TaxID=55149 RepID=A0A8D2DE22_SCIVU
MGGGNSKPKPNNGISSTIAPMTNPAPCLSSLPNTAHLILAFSAGVLLTLLLTAIVFLIIKSCRKYHYSSQVPDPDSDSPAKHSSIPEDSLTYASMTLQSLGEKSNHLTANHSADLDPVVYAQIKVTS